MKILLIDAMNMAHRMKHVFKELKDSTGKYNTGVVYGVLNELSFLIKEFSPDDIYFCMDSKAMLSWRITLSNAYKQTRRDRRLSMTDDEVVLDNVFRKQQLPDMDKLLKLLALPVIEVDMLEADDIIGYFVRNVYRGAGGDEFVIVSTDSDLFQLAYLKRVRVYVPTIGAFIYTTSKGELVSTVKGSLARSAKEFTLRKAIVGDTSDNIIGVKGIGDKTCDALLGMLDANAVATHSFETTLQELHTACFMEGKPGAKAMALLNNFDTVRLNLQLIDLRHEAAAAIAVNAKEHYRMLPDTVRTALKNSLSKDDGYAGSVLHHPLEADPAPLLNFLRRREIGMAIQHMGEYRALVRRFQLMAHNRKEVSFVKGTTVAKATHKKSSRVVRPSSTFVARRRPR